MSRNFETTNKIRAFSLMKNIDTHHF